MTGPVSKPAKSVSTLSKAAKSTAMAPLPRSEPQANNTRPGCERRPSDKVAAQRKHVLHYSFFNLKKNLVVLEQQEADLLRAQKAERRALRDKRAIQKANQLANVQSDGEGEYESRGSPTVCFSGIKVLYFY